MQGELKVGDENGFCQYSENFIYNAQDALRRKKDMETEALIGTFEKLEELIYKKALIDCAPVTYDSVWMKYEAIVHYLNNCRKIIHSLETKDYDWKKLFDDTRGNTQSFYAYLMSENHKQPNKQSNKRNAIKSEGAKTKISKPKAPSQSKSKNGPKISKKAQNQKNSGSTTNLVPYQTQSLAQHIGSSNLNISSDIGGFEQVFDDNIEEDIFMNEDLNDSDDINKTSSAFDESVWKSSLQQQQPQTVLPSMPSQSSQQIKSQEWQMAQRELAMQKQREIQRKENETIQKQKRENQDSSWIEHQPNAGDELPLGEDERRMRQRQIEEDRERERRALQQQKQTVFIDKYNLADQEELEEFMKNELTEEK